MARGDAAPAGSPFKRAVMAAATAFIAINIWTGAPLLALWVGSKAVGRSVLSMEAVFVVVIVLAVLLFPMVMALAWLNSSYNTLTGRPEGERRLRWLRSMSTQGEGRNEVGMSLLEWIVTTSVYVAVVALLVWFFFFAGSPLPD
jgi:hypothetical protein